MTKFLTLLFKIAHEAFTFISLRKYQQCGKGGHWESSCRIIVKSYPLGAYADCKAMYHKLVLAHLLTNKVSNFRSVLSKTVYY